MPAVLAEVSFVSSPADETQLENSAYRQLIAEALYKGVAQVSQRNHQHKSSQRTKNPALTRNYPVHPERASSPRKPER